MAFNLVPDILREIGVQAYTYVINAGARRRNRRLKSSEDIASLSGTWLKHTVDYPIFQTCPEGSSLHILEQCDMVDRIKCL